MVSLSQNVVAGQPSVLTGRSGLLDRYFYFCVALLFAVIVAIGFSRTVNQNLLHPAIARPRILWFHAGAFSGWILFFIFQSTLVRTHNIKWHRFFGWFGVALGTMMVPLGIATSIVMGRFDAVVEHRPGSDAFLIVPWYDMAAFVAFFGLAV